MCDPVTLTVAALGIANTAVQADAQRSQNFQNKKSARDALTVNNRDISIRALQEKIAAAQEVQALNLQAAEAASLTKVSAAGGNVGGMTVDMLLQDTENTRLAGLERIEQQTDATLDSLTRERSGALATSRNRAAQTSAPNPFAVGLRIGGAVTDAYVLNRSMAPKITPGGP